MAGKLTGWFAGRYLLPAVLGLAILSAVAVYRLSSRSGALALVITAIALAWFVRTEIHQLALARSDRDKLQAEIALLKAQPDTALRRVILGGRPGKRTLCVPAINGVDPEGHCRAAAGPPLRAPGEPPVEPPPGV